MVPREQCRILCNSELTGLYRLPSVVGTVKPRRLRWAGHRATMRFTGKTYRILEVETSWNMSTWKSGNEIGR
jgi:hypothetical protein